MNVCVEKQDYEPDFRDELKAYGKEVNLKGFRSGKVPPQVIKKRFGKLLVREVFNEVLDRELRAYLDEAGIELLLSPNLLGEPLTSEELLDLAEPHSFDMELCYAPPINFKPEDLPETQIFKPIISEEDLADRIEEILDKGAKQEEVETIEKGDFVEGVFTQASSDFEEETLLPTNQIAQEALPLFLGKAKGDTINFDLRTAFPEDKTLRLLLDRTEEFVKTMTGDFDFFVTTITRRVKAEINQDLFDSIFGKGEVTEEAEFRRRVEKHTIEEAEMEAKALVKKELRKKVLNHIGISFDTDFIRRLLTKQHTETKNRAKVTDENVASFEESLKFKAVVAHLINTAKLEVRDEDLDYAKHILVSRAVHPNSPTHLDLPKHMIDSLFVAISEKYPSTLSEMQIISEERRVIDYIFDKTPLVYQEISLKELNDFVEKEFIKAAKKEFTQKEDNENEEDNDNLLLEEDTQDTLAEAADFADTESVEDTKTEH